MRYLLIFVFSITLSLNAQQLAFPSAIGAGAYTTGGRGGQVIHVTTLDWDAPGGLKEAIQTTGARTIVFDVSGEIDATQEGAFAVLINGSAYDNMTIAGQTAPEGGITIKTSYFLFENVSNVIVRYIRFRNQGTPVQGSYFPDAFGHLAGSNLIYDHCTFSHGQDEAASWASTINSMGNVTVQNCFLQDSKTGSILGVGDVDGDFTFINNVYSNISHRFPNPKGNGQYDIINNVIYNWKQRLIRISYDGTYNVMNNYYKPSENGLRLPEWYGTGTITKLQRLQAKDIYNPLIYTSGNIVTGQRETPQSDDSDMWEYFSGSDSSYPVGDPVGSQFFTGTQFPLVGESYNIETANDAYTNLVLNGNVGAYKTLNADGTVNVYRDTKDTSDLNMIINDTYSGSFYDNQDVIPHPIVPENNRSTGYDTDNDGMPDTWETANGLNPIVADNNNFDLDAGYTNLEMFLNEVDGEVVSNPTVNVTGIQGLPATLNLTVGQTYDLTEEVLPANATDKTVVWSRSVANFATVDQNGLVTATSPGTVTITATTNDGGFTDSTVVTVTATPSGGNGKTKRGLKAILINDN